ncbi:MAG: aldolase [Bdellovibrionales bacterium RIFCSPHIGHO2_01_FULL_40_29]|nr:MAG: aldolase [Bdellovibrionales bacterium RIFCSPHIGHO2_01_FULL_40_29]OFZ33413.1 MAG: aldolase [Bdellovibrionales bacterium RIFCSPHIGHO2_02_FULL_40_15]
MTSLTAQRMAKEILTICERLHNRNMLAAADGNISFRVSDDEILITPSGVSKGFMDPSQMAVITLDGKTLVGNPSSEKQMHLEIYKTCARAKAVVHAHPLTAIAWSVARPDLDKLPSDCLSEVILSTGDIPFVPYARPGTADMGKVLAPFLPKHQAMILRNHGALAWGESLDEAYRGMERIEHSAQILAAAVQLGGLHPLPKEEIAYLYELRKKIGDVLL